MSQDRKSHQIDHHLSKLDKKDQHQNKIRIVVLSSILLLFILGFYMTSPDSELPEGTINDMISLDEENPKDKEGQAIQVHQNINKPLDKTKKIAEKEPNKPEEVLPSPSQKPEPPKKEIKTQKEPLTINDNTEQEEKISEKGNSPTSHSTNNSNTGSSNTRDIVISASFPGGPLKMEQFLKENVLYPEIALEQKIAGTVDVQIRVDEKGRIAKKKIVKGLGYGCDEAVLNAVSLMPTWIPSLKNGKPIARSYIITVTFDLPH